VGALRATYESAEKNLLETANRPEMATSSGKWRRTKSDAAEKGGKQPSKNDCHKE